MAANQTSNLLKVNQLSKDLNMKSKDLSEVNFTYYQVAVFNKTNLKDFEKYIPAEE